jgi:crotonobetainyl-CoA:carnitine CoA-transferase CaiB-like acyl-CoA transferase
MIALVKEEQFARLAATLGRRDLAADPRFVDFSARAHHAEALVAAIAEVLAGDTTAAWLDRLRAADILADRINGFDEWLLDPHVVATGGAVAVPQPGMGRFQTPRTPGVPAAVEAALRPAPRIGEHGLEILQGLGFDTAAIAGFAAEGALRLPQPA